jgi:outer membrane PBP1 activator LpoA protein
MEKSIVLKFVIILMTISLINCSFFNSTPEKNFITPPAIKKSTPSQTIHTLAFWEHSPSVIWEKLLHTPYPKLIYLQHQQDIIQYPTKKAWIQLALIAKQNNLSTTQLVKKLLHWRRHYPTHPANQLLPDDQIFMQLYNLPPPKQIAVLLPENGIYKNASHAIREGFLHAYYKNLLRSNKQNLKFYDTSQSKNIIALYQKALSEGADFVIGPLIKNNVQQLLRTNSFTQPTLALNYTDEVYHSIPPHFYEFGLLPEDEPIQMAEHAKQAGYEQALIIAPQNEWGKRLVRALTTRWKTLGGSILNTWFFNPKTHFVQEITNSLQSNPLIEINAETKFSKTQNNKRVIFLFSSGIHAYTIIPLLREHYLNIIPIYTTSSIYSIPINHEYARYMNGVMICDISRKKTILPAERLYAIGQDAYQISQALPRLIHLSPFPIDGVTGTLTLSSQHQIHRHLPCFPFHELSA